MKIDWTIKKFAELTPFELYNIIWLRNQVFVVEQNCVFQDADHKDEASIHIYGNDENGKIVAYARIVPPGMIYPEASIGRVVTNPDCRKYGAGRELMARTMAFINKNYKTPVRIGAQLYLKAFYEGFGFLQVGDIYLEDGIEHIIMLKSA